MLRTVGIPGVAASARAVEDDRERLSRAAQATPAPNPADRVADRQEHGAERDQHVRHAGASMQASTSTVRYVMSSAYTAAVFTRQLTPQLPCRLKTPLVSASTALRLR